MSQKRNFEEVSGGSNNTRWEPQKDAKFTAQNPTAIEGYFKSIREQVGPNGPFNVITIAVVDDKGNITEDMDMSGGAVMDDKFEKTKMGSFVRVEYHGKLPSKTPGRSYNNWKIFVDPNAIPYDKSPRVEGYGTEKIQAPSQNNTGAAPAQNGAGTGFPDNDDLPF